MLKFNIEEKTSPKILINIGSLMDIPTASVSTGMKGESIINGGLGQMTAIVGNGNNFKSTILHYMMLSAASKIKDATDTGMSTYDTEVNISLDRLEALADRFPNLGSNVITRNDDPLWDVTDKSLMPANKWVVQLNKYMEDKSKDKSSQIDVQPFKDPYGKGPLKFCIPTFVEIDSLTEFEAESTAEMLTEDLDGNDTNTYAMKQGLFKTKFLSTLPRLANQANVYFLFTAHIGEKIDLGGMYAPKPTKKLQFLKSGDNIKGVSTKFTFLMNNAWVATPASVLKNNTTGLAEYPKSGDDRQETDLNVVKLLQLRSKSGPSGYQIPIVVSQVEGVLPALSEFHYIKENGKFGISGSNISYNLDIYPEVSLSRTTVRNKLDNDPKLRRAVNITAELLEATLFFNWVPERGYKCTAQELYEDIKKLGYDWDILLRTREYWTINQYDHPVPFLSIVDLLKMRKGEYHPYFLDQDKKLLPKYAGIMGDEVKDTTKPKTKEKK